MRYLPTPGRSLDGRKVLRFENGTEIRTQNLSTALLLTLCICLLAAVSVHLGQTRISIQELLEALSGSVLDEEQDYALWTIRIPRLLMAFMVGWSMAIAGAVMQSLARNPLADPGLFGLNQGATTMILLLIVLVPAASKLMIMSSALIGGLLVATLLIWLVGGGARTHGLAILLMGIALETVLSSITSLLILYTPQEVSYALADWLAGSLFNATAENVLTFLPFFVFSFAGILLIGPCLSRYELGNDAAMTLGLSIRLTRPLILGFAVLLSTAAVTSVGPLTFLGILAPHIAAFLTPLKGRARLFISGLVGGLLVISADVLTRSLESDIPVPIGLSLTLIGVPLFILALRLQAINRQTQH